jgi:hypothetical protein
MSAPDIFALGGRPNEEDEAESIDLSQACREWREAWDRLRCGALTDEETEDLIEEIWDWVDTINEAEPASMIDCVIKLAVIALHQGCGGAERAEDFKIAARQVIDFLQGMMTASP